jgi:hypothetical protein
MSDHKNASDFIEDAERRAGALGTTPTTLPGCTRCLPVLPAQWVPTRTTNAMITQPECC